MEAVDLESLATEVRRRARLAPEDVLLATRIAERLGVAVRRAPGLIARACLYRAAENDYRIYLRSVGPDTNFDIAHELGHFALRTIARYDGADEERFANYVAAAILAPIPVVHAVHRSHEALKAIRPLARTTGLSQTAAQLRLGEVIGDERAVLTKRGNVLLRSKGAFPWSEVKIAEASASELRAVGLVKTILRGGIDTGRVALRAR